MKALFIKKISTPTNKQKKYTHKFFSFSWKWKNNKGNTTKNHKYKSADLMLIRKVEISMK